MLNHRLLEKVAAELIIDPEPGPKEYAKAGLKNALLVGAGTALGTGTGTLINHLLEKNVSEATKRSTFPVAGTILGGLSALAATVLSGYTQKSFNENIMPKVLVKAPQEQAEEIKQKLLRIAPREAKVRVYVSGDPKAPTTGYQTTYSVGPDITADRLHTLIWGGR